MTNDIVTRLRTEIADARQGGIWVFAAEAALEAADELERVEAERERLWLLINSIDRAIHKREPINPWQMDRLVVQQMKQWPTLWTAIRTACSKYLELNNA